MCLPERLPVNPEPISRKLRILISSLRWDTKVKSTKIEIRVAVRHISGARIRNSIASASDFAFNIAPVV